MIKNIISILFCVFISCMCISNVYGNTNNNEDINNKLNDIEFVCGVVKEKVEFIMYVRQHNISKEELIKRYESANKDNPQAMIYYKQLIDYVYDYDIPNLNVIGLNKIFRKTFSEFVYTRCTERISKNVVNDILENIN